MSLECVYCEAELVYEDSYGSLAALRGESKLTGDIYRCPNHEGFEEEEVALSYLRESGETFESLGITGWEEIYCDSCTHYVSGSFYTDSNGNLQEGYPC